MMLNFSLNLEISILTYIMSVYEFKMNVTRLYVYKFNIFYRDKNHKLTLIKLIDPPLQYI